MAMCMHGSQKRIRVLGIKESFVLPFKLAPRPLYITLEVCTCPLLVHFDIFFAVARVHFHEKTKNMHGKHTSSSP